MEEGTNETPSQSWHGPHLRDVRPSRQMEVNYYYGTEAGVQGHVWRETPINGYHRRGFPPPQFTLEP